jgi:hypothetical protein
MYCLGFLFKYISFRFAQSRTLCEGGAGCGVSQVQGLDGDRVHETVVFGVFFLLVDKPQPADE